MAGSGSHVQALRLKAAGRALVRLQTPGHQSPAGGFSLKGDKMKIIITVLMISLISVPAYALCKPGETWFDWTEFKTERCDEKSQTYEILPWQKKNETCLWVDFPQETETNGNAICRKAHMGACRGLVRMNILNKPINFTRSEYECGETLYFKQYEKVCSPSPFEGLPAQCSQIEAQVSCCN